MQTLNITGYKFINLKDLPNLQRMFFETCTELSIKGTILLSHEGININLSGDLNNIKKLKIRIENIPDFTDITFRESLSNEISFNRLKIKIKKEIITFKEADVNPALNSAPPISPKNLKKLLDKNTDITLLDTRNDYEIKFGTFQNALNLEINNFLEFKDKLNKIPKDKPVVMFCTGGIRCEKAGTHLINNGYSKVYQLEGGILNYFQQIGADHYNGECFIFDNRVSLNHKLQQSKTR
ncbi:rhodanese-like domain-containing protein [Gammaproteobacteria bacterium]|nr:rhodanese-like domain-containing protein [Gammaproteobacteria bacterium]